jgi:hypothetical protein
MYIPRQGLRERQVETVGRLLAAGAEELGQVAHEAADPDLARLRLRVGGEFNRRFEVALG